MPQPFKSLLSDEIDNSFSYLLECANPGLSFKFPNGMSFGSFELTPQESFSDSKQNGSDLSRIAAMFNGPHLGTMPDMMFPQYSPSASFQFNKFSHMNFNDKDLPDNL